MHLIVKSPPGAARGAALYDRMHGIYKYLYGQLGLMRSGYVEAAWPQEKKVRRDSLASYALFRIVINVYVL